jgi:type III restriction enzyme
MSVLNESQKAIIAEIGRRVDAWRGFPLQGARVGYSSEGRYQPVAEGERAVSETTRTLLQHWFRPEAHEVLGAQGVQYFKYWPHQRKTVETLVYLHEVLGVRRVEELWRAGSVEPTFSRVDPWSKIGAQLATGAGKTKVMSLLIAWALLNATREVGSPLGFGRHALVIAPGLFVRDRLLLDFAPSDPDARTVFAQDPVIPPSLRDSWNLKVYSPDTCPAELPRDECALVVTNYHQLRKKPEPVVAPVGSRRRAVRSLFEEEDPRKLEDIDTPLIERFRRSKGLLVINDEAHHVWDEPGHARKESRGRAGPSAEDRERATEWIEALRALHAAASDNGRLTLQVDLSATLFEEDATTFRHAVVDYSLHDAIRDGIVKRPVLEQIEVTKKGYDTSEPLIKEGATDAWDKYKNLIYPGIARWRELVKLHAAEGGKKPLLFLLCANKTEAAEVANFLRYGRPVKEDLSSETPTGFCDPADPAGSAPLFVTKSPSGETVSTVVEVHIGKSEQSSQKDWDKVRAIVNSIDRDAIPDPSGARDAFGRPVMIPNPYNVVVSVMMLKEGWDVRGVQVIVPLRPCDSRTLTEQILGRGLRKMHATHIEEDGTAYPSDERLFVMEHPSFKKIIEDIKDIVEVETGAISHLPEYAPVSVVEDEDKRKRCDTPLVHYEGHTEIVRDWRDTFSVDSLPPLKKKRPWREDFDSTIIKTTLVEMLKASPQEGQTIELSSDLGYRDLERVLESMYVIPLLRRLQKSYHHKNAVKSVVREFLERRTFALPAGLPLSFDRAIEGDEESARIVLGNLAQIELRDAVVEALLDPLRVAMNQRLPSTAPLLRTRWASEIEPYQASKKNKPVFEAPERSSLCRAVLDNKDEHRVAQLIDRCSDVVGWVYNHSKVGYWIEYEWDGRIAKYIPDFVVRAKLGAVEHFAIIEVKGAMDSRDGVKARRGVEYARLLTESTKSPWHYVMLVENSTLKRRDITEWEKSSHTKLAELLSRQEERRLVPRDPSTTDAAPSLVANVPPAEQFIQAVPVVDLVAKAGPIGDSIEPRTTGWLRWSAEKRIDRDCFVARAEGDSMHAPSGAGIPDGAWVLFRRFATPPALRALDGRRVLVEVRDASAPEDGGSYLVKRLVVSKTDSNGEATELALRSDNPKHAPTLWSEGGPQLRVIAEVVDVL